MNSKCIYKKRDGAVLLSSLFIALIATMMSVTMLSMADINSNQITDNRSGTMAYYAAEAGIEEVENLFNKDLSLMGETLASLDLPTDSSRYSLANNAEYWVDSLAYEDSNTVILVEVVGKFGDAYRKIKAKMRIATPAVFDDYGLLTDGILTIHGTKVLNMSVHGNDGLDFSGGDTLNNNSVATQSVDPTGGAPHAVLNPVGGYIPDIEVPSVPIDDLRTLGLSDGIVLDLTQEDLLTKIDEAPTNSNVYIAADSKINKNILTLSGDYEGKTIFVDGSITINIDGASPLSNVTIVASGEMVVNGSVDVVSSHADEIDVVFASGGNVDLNGSRDFTSLFWSNGRFTQNGASLAGRVIASEAIFLNGSFILTNSDELTDIDAFDKVVSTYSWQLVSMD